MPPTPAVAVSRSASDALLYDGVQAKLSGWTLVVAEGRHAERFPGEGFDREYLMPYPGPYLDPEVDLKAEAVRALDEKYPEFRKTRAPEELAEGAASLARVKAEEFFDYRKRWRATLAGLESCADFAKVCGGLRIGPI